MPPHHDKTLWLYKGGTRYEVQSRTRPERVHHVNTFTLSCTCEAGSYSRRCWALSAALLYESYRRHEEAKAAAAKTTPATGMAALQEAFV